MFDPYTPISFPMLSFPRPCYHLYYPQTSFSIFSLSRSPTRPRLLSFDSLPNEGCFVTVEHVSRLSFKHVHLAFFSRVCHTASFSPCPSFLLSLPFLFYTPFSTWSSRRIHSRDTPFLFFFLLLLLLPSSSVSLYPLLLRTYTDVQDDVPFYFIRGYEFFHPRRARVSLSLSPSHQPPPRHGASLKMERRGWLRLCRRRTRRDGWLRDGQSIFFFLFRFFFFFENLFYR